MDCLFYLNQNPILTGKPNHTYEKCYHPSNLHYRLTKAPLPVLALWHQNYLYRHRYLNQKYGITEIDFTSSEIEFVPAYKAKSVGLDNVYCISIEDINYINEFDAIWACASLLHIELNKLELSVDYQNTYPYVSLNGKLFNELSRRCFDRIS